MPRKAEPEKQRYQGRPEVRTDEVKGLFAEEDGQASIIAQVLTKVRTLVAEPRSFN